MRKIAYPLILLKIFSLTKKIAIIMFIAIFVSCIISYFDPSFTFNFVIQQLKFALILGFLKTLPTLICSIFCILQENKTLGKSQVKNSQEKEEICEYNDDDNLIYNSNCDLDRSINAVIAGKYIMASTTGFLGTVSHKSKSSIVFLVLGSFAGITGLMTKNLQNSEDILIKLKEKSFKDIFEDEIAVNNFSKIDKFREDDTNFNI